MFLLYIRLPKPPKHLSPLPPKEHQRHQEQIEPSEEQPADQEKTKYHRRNDVADYRHNAQSSYLLERRTFFENLA